MNETLDIKTWTELLPDWQLWVRAKLLGVKVEIANFEPYVKRNELVTLRLTGSPRNIKRLEHWIINQFVNPDDMPAPFDRDQYTDKSVRIEAIIPADRLDYMIETCDADVKSIEEI